MSTRPLTHEEKIERESWQQARDARDMADDVYRDADPLTHEVIWEVHQGMKDLREETLKPSQGEALIDFYERRYRLGNDGLIRWGITQDYSPLVWEQYGYGLDKPPDWYYTALWKAKLAARIVKPADVRYQMVRTSPETFHYTIWDAANPFYTRWEMNAYFPSRNDKAMEAYVQKEYANHKRLHEGAVNALIHYRETGQAVMPSWIPDNGLRITNRNGKLVGLYPRLEGK